MPSGTEGGSADPDVTEGFTSVDAQPDPSQLVNAMLATAQWPAVRLLRSWEWDHLAPRPGETAINLPDDAVDVVRCERVLQWLPEYERAISEMARVLRPGGRIVVIDSDWSTARADVGDDDAAMAFVDSMTAFRGPPATVGRRLLNLLRRAGLTDVEATASTHLWTTWDPDEPPGGNGLFPIRAMVDQLTDMGRLDPGLGARFAAALVDAGRSDRFFLSVGMLAVGGVQT